MSGSNGSVSTVTSSDMGDPKKFRAGGAPPALLVVRYPRVVVLTAPSQVAYGVCLFALRAGNAGHLGGGGIALVPSSAEGRGRFAPKGKREKGFKGNHGTGLRKQRAPRRALRSVGVLR
jgi:hypothetical protein